MTPTSPSHDPLSDDALMRAVQEEDPSAFPLLYERYEKKLYNFLLRMTGNSAQAEDLFQETFLRIYRARHRYNSQIPFRPWLYTIALNLSRDLLARRGRERLTSGDVPAEIPDPGADPLRPLLRAEQEERVRRALQALPERPRTILILSRYEGLRYAEIAAILQMTPEAVKMAAHRALDTLRAKLQVE